MSATAQAHHIPRMIIRACRNVSDLRASHRVPLRAARAAAAHALVLHWVADRGRALRGPIAARAFMGDVSS
eukprot:374013-Pyramimonas_sp.AAC.1